MAKRFYEEENFGLSGFEREDFLKFMLDWVNDDEVTSYMITGRYPATRENLEKTFDEDVSEGNAVFAIYAKEPELIIGTAGLYRFDSQSRHAEFRILIGDKKRWGEGIGSGVCNYLVKYGFERLNFNKIWLGANEENKGAIKSYERAGFKHEGRLRQELYRNGKYYDILRMSILRKEYEDGKKD